MLSRLCPNEESRAGSQMCGEYLEINIRCSYLFVLEGTSISIKRGVYVCLVVTRLIEWIAGVLFTKSCNVL